MNFVELESLMLHAMFQDHRTSLKVFAIYGREPKLKLTKGSLACHETSDLHKHNTAIPVF